MAEKNIIIQRKKSDGTYDQYYPKTKVENVEGAETPAGAQAKASAAAGMVASELTAHKAERATQYGYGHIRLQDIPLPTIATQTEAEAGTNNTKMMTPLRVAQAVNSRIRIIDALQAEIFIGGQWVQYLKKPDDYWGTPGSGYLVAGDMNEGYFGFVSASQLISGNSLAQAIGLSSGISQFSDAGWLKWVKNNKIIFVAKKTLRHSISWNQIDAVGAVYGDTRVKIGKFSFKVRLLTGGQYPGGGEWNDLMYGVHKDRSPNWDNFNDADLQVGSGNGHRTWCQDTYATSMRTVRGGGSITGFTGSTPENTGSDYGWRPCLELEG